MHAGNRHRIQMVLPTHPIDSQCLSCTNPAPVLAADSPQLPLRPPTYHRRPEKQIHRSLIGSLRWRGERISLQIRSGLQHDQHDNPHHVDGRQAGT